MSMWSDVLQGSFVGCNIFIIDRDYGIECILSKLVDDTKFSGAVDITERAGAILRDLHKLEG